MEILAIFFVISGTVLGFLCLIVLEYQNRRTKQWRPIQTTRPLPPPASPPIPPASTQPRKPQNPVHAA